MDSGQLYVAGRRLVTREQPELPCWSLMLIQIFDLPLAKRLEMGGRCQTSQDGKEGFAMLEEGVDLVLTDVDMPRLDGFGLIEWMRATPDYRFQL